MQSREVRACWRAEPREVRAQNYTLRKERAAQGADRCRKDKSPTTCRAGVCRG